MTAFRPLLFVTLLAAGGLGFAPKPQEETYTYEAIVGKAPARFTLTMTMKGFSKKVTGSYYLLSKPSAEYELSNGSLLNTRLTIDEYTLGRTADPAHTPPDLTAKLYLSGDLQHGFVGKMINTTDSKQFNVALFGVTP